MANGQTTAITPYNQKVNDVRGLLEKAKGQIALALPKHMNPDRLLRITLSSCNRNPKLFDCDRMSLIAAVMQSAALGLEPDGALGEAYLIPYGSQVQFQAGYKGLMKLARNSGMVGAIGGNVVRKRDVFDYEEGPEGKLHHVPFKPTVPDDADDLALREGGESMATIAGPMTHAYAWARLKDGTIQKAVMTRAQVLAIRARSQAWGYYVKSKKECPWVTDPEPMWIKTAIKRLMKLCPQSAELAKAIALDSAAEAGLSQDFSDVIDTTATEDKAPPRTPSDLLPTPDDPASDRSGQ